MRSLLSLTLVSVLVSVSMFFLSACGNSGGATGDASSTASGQNPTADTPTTPGANQPTSPPGSPPTVQPKFLTHAFSDGRKAIFDLASKETILTPPLLQAELVVGMVTTNYGFLDDGANSRQKCTSYRGRAVGMQKLYFEALKDTDDSSHRASRFRENLQITVSDGEGMVGYVELKLALETDAFAKTYLASRWPSEFPSAASAVRAQHANDLRYDVLNSQANDTITGMQKTINIEQVEKLPNQYAALSVNLYCDLLLGNFQVALVDRQVGATSPVKITGSNL